ncbi:MAG TPA: sensor domain-containing diguanylate cyclase [Candidatus Brocadiia bacterium]|nr:sensor domain-containing diguanylate cyclase [Candidatus Brocadiia bacterium]
MRWSRHARGRTGGPRSLEGSLKSHALTFLRDRVWGILAAATILVSLYCIARRGLGVWEERLAWTALITASYSFVAGILLVFSREKLADFKVQLDLARERIGVLEAEGRDYRRRIDELSTLREVAYVVNLEEDFDILLEKVLELVAALMEPTTILVMLVDEETDRLKPAARWAAGKTEFGAKVTAGAIPNFRPAMFQSQSMVLNSYEEEVHAVLPLRVGDDVIGAMFLVFSAGPAAGSDVWMQDFSNRYRVLLQEIARHLSLAAKTKYLHTIAVVDGLTGLFTKRYFQEQIAAHADRAARSSEPFSFIMFDIDHFKRVNDTYGHPTGDRVLVGVAKIIRSSLRKYDTSYRIGGEEMAAILPGTGKDTAAQVAERIRQKVEANVFHGENDEEIKVTISSGVAEFGHEIRNGEILVSRTDSCLYRAKNGGRNRVVVDGVSETPGGQTGPSPAQPADGERHETERKS